MSAAAERGRAEAGQLLHLVYRLDALDRQITLLYLEGESAAEIAAVTGLSAANVATKTHRIKRLLAKLAGAKKETK